MREAFERAIRENPDDAAAYSAYADWLQEQGDPRGEFMAVQLALEDETRSKAERDRLRARESELLAAHERDWLGGLAPHLLDPRPEFVDYHPDPQYRWNRGFLARLRVKFLTMGFAQALAAAPAARFLSELFVGRDARDYGMDALDQPPAKVPTPRGVRNHWELLELIGAPCLETLRVFQMGDEEPAEDGWADCHTYAEGIEHVIATMPRIEEIHLLCKGYSAKRLFGLSSLACLRVLRASALGNPHADRDYEIPLKTLAKNSVFHRLTHLSFHPHFAFERSFISLEQVRALVQSPHLPNLTHLQLRLSDMGDDGVRSIIKSGILKRLTWLDLRHGCVTDAGARLFAACPDAKRLDRLDLSRNGVTAAGLAALRAAGVNAVANSPLTGQELDGREYLREGDFE